jgi:gliding motility-associated-like protein
MASGGGSYLWTGPNNFVSNAQSPVISGASISDNGTYYVKVISEFGCINNDSTTLVVDVNPSVDAGASIRICEGSATTLQGSGTNTTSYIWSPDSGLSNSAVQTPSASPTETTLYFLTVKNGVCIASDSVLVTVSKKPVADAGPDKSFLKGQFATLDGNASGTNISYFWTPDLYLSSAAVLNPIVTPQFDTTYTLHVISNDGCGTATDDVLVRYFNDVYIPNAFTPNNDGVNDFWKIPILSAFPLAEVSVYNRYGELVFFNKGFTKPWDGTYKGTPQSSGVYGYIVDLKNGIKKFTGVVTLIR